MKKLNIFGDFTTVSAKLFERKGSLMPFRSDFVATLKPLAQPSHETSSCLLFTSGFTESWREQNETTIKVVYYFFTIIKNMYGTNTYFILMKDFLMLLFTFTYLTKTCIFNSWYFNFYQIRHVSVYRFSWAELQYVADQAESRRSFSVGRPTRNLKQKFKPFLCWNPHWKWLSSKSF